MRFPESPFQPSSAPRCLEASLLPAVRSAPAHQSHLVLCIDELEGVNAKECAAGVAVGRVVAGQVLRLSQAVRMGGPECFELLRIRVCRWLDRGAEPRSGPETFLGWAAPNMGVFNMDIWCNCPFGSLNCRAIPRALWATSGTLGFPLLPARSAQSPERLGRKTVQSASIWRPRR